jgi:hypothetical protein
MRGKPAQSGIERRSKRLECREMHYFTAVREADDSSAAGDASLALK